MPHDLTAAEEERARLQAMAAGPPQDSELRRTMLEMVRAARPWRYSRSGLKRAVGKKDSRVKPGRITKALNTLLADGCLVEEYRERAFGLKMRLALPDVSEHALPEVPARNTRMVPARGEAERLPFRGQATAL